MRGVSNTGYNFVSCSKEGAERFLEEGSVYADIEHSNMLMLEVVLGAITVSVVSIAEVIVECGIFRLYSKNRL